MGELKKKAVPLILCSSKTRAEMLPLQKELGVAGPMICENGGGVFAPRNHPITRGGQWRAANDKWSVWPIGMSIKDLRERFAGFKEDFGARGFGDMTESEVAGLTGLTLPQAALARRREFNEPLILPRAREREKDFIRAAAAAGLKVTQGGRFYHLLGGGDKGKAVELVRGLYGALEPGLLSMALGDAPNDGPMLAAVDRPVLVARPGGGHADIGLPGLLKVGGIGPKGWNEAVLQILKEMG